MRKTQLSSGDRETLIVLLTELDRGLQRHDVGNSLWYIEWRLRMAVVIDVEESELNSRTL